MNYLTYPRVLNLLQAGMGAAQVINVAAAMNHGNWMITACVTAFVSAVQTYLHLEGMQTIPPGAK